MKKYFGSIVLILSLVLTACGRDGQGGQPAPNGPAAPIVEQPVDDGYYNGGAVGGYCGFFCRWRLRRQQRAGGCY